MQAFGKSQPIRRIEDQRFLTGEGRYVDDIAPAGAAVAYFLRSAMAHAEFGALDLDEARAAPGVLAVLTVEDLEAQGVKVGMFSRQFPNRDGSDGAFPERPCLARKRVRFVGEPIACIIAETMEAAKDAADLIMIDYNDLPVHLDIAPGGPEIHPEAPGNVAIDYGFGDEAAVEQVFAGAAKVLSYDISDNRIFCNAMEPRACYAEWQDGRMHLCFGGQNVWGIKQLMAGAFGLAPDAVRVTIPDVGGGFGTKAFPYPEYYAVIAAARLLGRPVKWMAERTESMLTDNSGRDLVSTAELALDAGHKIIGYRVKNVFNIGAYNSVMSQGIQTDLFTKVMMGTYDCQAAYLHSVGVYTNTTQVDAYRGAGRPEAIYVLERAMDYAARDLGLDPWEFRRMNFIRPDQFPYRSATGELYDVGDFGAVLAKAEAQADRAGFAARRAASHAAGKLRGLGLCYYIESILGEPSESVQVDFNADGTATIYVGTVSNGQGHETTMVSYLSDQTGIPADKIRFVQADSDAIAQGGGTGGSRSMTVQTNVTFHAVRVMVAAYSAFLADEMGLPAEAVQFDDERFRAEGSNLTPTFLEAAEMARAAGREDLLKFMQREELPGRSYPNGAHIAEVEIDPDTGETEVVRYTVTDDFGNLLNPLLAEGQVHGGVAQGVGQAVQERVVYDETGQLLTASFMDYAMPRAQDLPWISFTTYPVPSTANPLGMKGCGEAGTVGALAAVANAVLDATWDKGARRVDMPFTPGKMWETLKELEGEAI
ncbi:putative hypoxanthine oxidase XdhD [Candidatus Rhodobacter oscarellae]|uniref:Putative hypoxanthine oxidase XdhD n=1 Tax=Candidatus Rhodobacter oscarellae TaxID=1675527 RepID=A0A0J9E9R1_9RHOB|nr:xanthine dehydrogenase family protein molybdopterin-binding subunit [Candidatus Rhodobacter lobularis]KMW58404.1 putative hypoxanthine oxidase XdhD [Candidatus Rhodobacter lobularis]